MNSAEAIQSPAPKVEWTAPELITMDLHTLTHSGCLPQSETNGGFGVS